MTPAGAADPAAALARLAEEIRAHRGCGFESCETCTYPAPGEGSATAEIAETDPPLPAAP